MVQEHAPSRNGRTSESAPSTTLAGPDFWHSLINEAEAARFLGLTVRCLQGWRYKGGGPKFVRISARCIRYRRRDCREFFEARLRTSTSDPGPEPG